MKARQSSLWVVVLGLAIAAWCPGAFAVPAPPLPVQLVQPDGAPLAVRAYGDEHGLFFETEGGYTVVRDARGNWRYAVRGGSGRLVPSDLKAGDGDPRSLGVARHLRHDDTIMQQIERKRRQANAARQIFPPVAKRKAMVDRHAAPTRAEADGSGEEESESAYPGMTPAPAAFRLAVLLIEFPADRDNPAVPHTYTQAQVNQMLLSADSYHATPLGEAAYGSMRDYFHAVSGGQFSLTGQTFPWVTASRSKAYYDANGDWDLLQEAIVKSGANPANFDGFALIYAGAVGSNQLWPHAYMGGSPLSYTSSEQFFSDDLSDIGVHSHEFAHLLGLWDLYHGVGSIGYWGLMGSGCYGGNGSTDESPVQLLGLEKEMLGWATPVVLTAGSHSLSIPASETVGPVYKAVSERSYFYIENRQRAGYDRYLPATGLTVWHVDMTATNVVDPAPARIDMEEADGMPAYYATAGAPFPGSAGNVAFGCASTPSSADYDGSCSVSLGNISESSGVVTLDIHVAWRQGIGITVAGTGNYPTLFTALNSALPGQTVYAPPGVYTERVVMRRGVDLAGAGPGKSILQDVSTPGAFLSILVAGADDTVLAGFTLKGANYLSSDYGQEGAGYDMADTTFAYARVSNCAFVGFSFGVNTTHMYGSPGISPGSLEVANNYFERNSTAVAMWQRGTPQIRNNVFVGNFMGVQRVYSDAAVGIVDYNALFDNQIDLANVFAPEFGTHNLSADPRLVAPAAEDYRLQSTSPCINAGDPAVAYNDQDGTRNDMGVFGGPLAPLAPLAITTASLPSGTLGSAYSQTLAATGGKAPRTWSLAGGTLPPGLSLDAAPGVISGTPTAAGTASFTVRVTDDIGTTATKALSIAIATPLQPDLVVTVVSGPTSGTRGKKVTVRATAKNQGPAGAAASTLSFYLSTDATITTADRKLSDVSVTSLAAGASKALSSYVTLPTSLAAGTYFIGAIADRAAVVAESNETNNWKAGNTIVLK
jgi:M6 family metalloprotease-like protein